MHKLERKNILIVSPERWGSIYLSKHHYAIKLAERGNNVIFLNQPSAFTPFQLKIEVTTDLKQPNLSIANYTYPVKGHLHFPSYISKPIYAYIIKKIEQQTQCNIDIIWCFDTSSFSHWSFTPKSILKILHIVDLNIINHFKKLYEQADFVFGSSPEIIEELKKYNPNCFFINHGLALRKFKPGPKNWIADNKIKVGYVGNLLMTYIDWDSILTIVSENPEIEFHFFGPYEQSNIGWNESGFEAEKVLQKHPNTFLKGPVPSDILLEEISGMDAFLLAYDSNKHLKQLSNPHKILELLVTGKTIITNNLLSYQDKVGLLEMAQSNHELPLLFKKSMNNIRELNNLENQKKRISYALQNTYEEQIKRIESIIYGTAPY